MSQYRQRASRGQGGKQTKSSKYVSRPSAAKAAPQGNPLGVQTLTSADVYSKWKEQLGNALVTEYGAAGKSLEQNDYVTDPQIITNATNFWLIFTDRLWRLRLLLLTTD